MKKRTIFDLILIFLLLIVLIFLGTRDYTQKENIDNQKFDKEYSLVGKDNVFKYVDEEKVNDIIKNGNGIIFMAFSKNEWSNYYAKILNDAAKESNIKEIYYYNFKIDREKQSTEYKKIVDYLKKYLKQDDLGNVNINAPSLVIIKDNNIIYYDDETQFINSSITPKNYWTNDNMEIKKQQLVNVFINYQGGSNNGGEE